MGRVDEHLVQRIARNEGSDIVRAEVLDESHDAGRVADRHVLRLPENGLVEDHRLRGAGEFLVLAEPGDPHQHVAMFAGDEGRVDAQVASDRCLRPAAGERTPRPLEPLEREVPEVGLQELPDVVAELHVKITVEHRGLLTLSTRRGYGIPEHVQRRLPKDPGVRVVSGHDSHADAQVAVAAEDVHGAGETRPLRSVADLRSHKQRERTQHQQSRF